VAIFERSCFCGIFLFSHGGGAGLPGGGGLPGLGGESSCFNWTVVVVKLNEIGSTGVEIGV